MQHSLRQSREQDRRPSGRLIRWESAHRGSWFAEVGSCPARARPEGEVVPLDNFRGRGTQQRPGRPEGPHPPPVRPGRDRSVPTKSEQNGSREPRSGLPQAGPTPGPNIRPDIHARATFSACEPAAWWPLSPDWRSPLPSRPPICTSCCRSPWPAQGRGRDRERLDLSYRPAELVTDRSDARGVPAAFLSEEPPCPHPCRSAPTATRPICAASPAASATAGSAPACRRSPTRSTACRAGRRRGSPA